MEAVAAKQRRHTPPELEPETSLTDYHYEQGRKLSLSIRKLSRLPISFEEAREIAKEQQVMLP